MNAPARIAFNRRDESHVNSLKRFLRILAREIAKNNPEGAAAAKLLLTSDTLIGHGASRRFPRSYLQVTLSVPLVCDEDGAVE
jgi:hypothetical protein